MKGVCGELFIGAVAAGGFAQFLALMALAAIVEG